MTYIRFSLMRPQRGNEERVVSLVERLNSEACKHEECRDAQLYFDGTGGVARIAFYEDEDGAERVAQDPTILAIRSELHGLIEPGHEEHGLSSERR